MTAPTENSKRLCGLEMVKYCVSYMLFVFTFCGSNRSRVSSNRLPFQLFCETCGIQSPNSLKFERSKGKIPLNKLIKILEVQLK